MKEPCWVLESVVLNIHDQQMKEHGGQSGIRDIGLLQSAINHPKFLWKYKEITLHNLAAGYAAKLCANHPFIDGNKRVAFVVMRLFLKLNGKDIDASPKNKIEIFMLLANGRFSENELSGWILEHII